jgi:hypothetical protein
MKLKPFVPSLSLLVFAALGLTATTSSARPPRARELCGVLQNVDAGAHRLALLPSGGGKPLEVDWRPDTSFVRGGEFDRADSLNEGARVCVYYRSPFFGRPFVTKVVWQGKTAALQH